MRRQVDLHVTEIHLIREENSWTVEIECKDFPEPIQYEDGEEICTCKYQRVVRYIPSLREALQEADHLVTIVEDE